MADFSKLSPSGLRDELDELASEDYVDTVASDAVLDRATALDVRDYGAVLDGSTNDRAAILAAIADLPDDNGMVVISGGHAAIDGAIELAGHQHVYLAADGGVVVPSGYTGSVFRFTSKYSSVTGPGQINRDSGSEWTAFHFDTDGAAGGVHHNRVEGVYVYSPGVAFHFDNSSNNSAVNGNVIEGVRVHKPVVVWEFSDASGLSNRCSRNVSYAVDVQADSDTTHILKNVLGMGNEFHFCRVFDANNSVSEVSEDAESTLIVGGRGLTLWGWDDQGTNTRVLDADRDILAADSHSHGDMPPSGSDMIQVPQLGMTNGSLSMDRDRLYLVPVMLEAPCTFARFGGRITSAGGASSVLRVGVYDSVDMEPRNLLVEDTVSASSSGSISFTDGDSSLPAGLVWMGVVAQDDDSTPEVPLVEGRSPYVFTPNAGAQALVNRNVRRTDGVTGALPSEISAGSTSPDSGAPSMLLGVLNA